MGSGVRNLYKFTKIYSGGEPELLEGDIFKTIIPTTSSESLGTSDTQKVAERVAEKVTEGEASVLALLAQNGEVTQNELANQLDVSRKTVYMRIKSLKDKGVIRRIGSDTRGYWEVIESNGE
jgi:ATP-dependent DNA helicase RecG